MVKKIYIIAGEKSGDNLGGRLIAKLREKSPQTQLKGIGGNKMIANGLEQSLFDIKEINLMGFIEVLPHAFKLIKLINKTVQDIINFKPEIVITIDSPGFNFRVVEKLRKLNFKTKFIHFVAPSVWAYKPERAVRTAKLFDELISIIPWEAPLFEKHGLKTTFVGHSLFEDLKILSDAEKTELKNKYKISPTQKIISIMAGSRIGEVKRNKKILTDAIIALNKQHKNTKFFILPTPENIGFTRLSFKNLANISYIADEVEKQKILQISDLAMVKSGTSSLEVSALGVPHFIFFKANPISIWFIKKIAISKFANLINISANKEIIKELLQENFTTNNIIEISNKILENTDYKTKLLSEIKNEIIKFKSPSSSSSELACDIILNQNLPLVENLNNVLH